MLKNGGPQATFNIIPHNAISANGGDGVAIDGNAYNVTVNFSNIGTDLTGFDALGNAQAGVYIGAGTHSTTVGSPDPLTPDGDKTYSGSTAAEFRDVKAFEFLPANAK